MRAMFPVEIQGETIDLRELEAEDAPAIAAVIADEAVLRYTTWKGPADLEAAKGFVRLAQESAAATPRRQYTLAIALRRSGEVIGTGFIRHDDEEGKVGSLGILLRPDSWGRGVATEAARMGLVFGFETLGLQRIEADPAAENVAVHRVLERVGMRRYEERPEHHLSPSGVLRDSIGFAIDREDFHGREQS